MAVQFIIDSASDILPEEAKQLGLIHLPLTIRFEETEYKDSVTLSHSEFYEKLIESDTLPKTSQINPAVFEEVFEEVTKKGDEVVVVTLSSKLSGTYQSALIAAQDYIGKVYVVDSKSVCVGERILIEYGLTLKNKGLGAEKIAEELDQKKEKIRVLALLDTLEYLKKGGRISAAVAFAGNILSIKPVVAVENGEVVLVGKARGSRQGNNLLRELILQCGGMNFTEPFGLAYSGLSDHLLQKYILDSADIWKGQVDTLPISTVGCAIGTHVGPGAIAIAFFEKQN